MRNRRTDALFVLEKNPSGVPRQWGTGDKEYERRISKSIGAFSICDFTNILNARSHCSWYWISLPCEILKKKFSLASSIVFNFCRVTGSKKFAFYVHVSSVSVWMCSLESFQAHQPEKCLFLFLLKQELQMQGNIIFPCPLSFMDL